MTDEARTPLQQRFQIYRWAYILCPILLAIAVGRAAIPGPVAPAAAWCACKASGPLADIPVHNFGIVEQGILYRSGQPPTLVLPWLRYYGIASIVNLREAQ